MINDDDDLPALPEDVGVHVLIGHMQALQKTMIRSVSRIEQLEAGIAEQATSIAKGMDQLGHQVRRLTVRSLWSFLSGIMLVALALVLISGALGRQWGRQEGYDEASTENAAAAWGATDEGRWAYAFAQTGELAMIRNCTNKGWQIVAGGCSPQTYSDGMVYGWTLTDRPRLSIRHRHHQSP